MPRRLVWVALLSGGCLETTPDLGQVSGNPFGSPPVVARTGNAKLSQASLEAATRVDSLGRQLVAANPDLGVNPLFNTVGVAEPELFHRGTAEINITEGLVQQCSTRGQLAAALCYELGKMVAEREAQAGAQPRSPEREPPTEVRVGNDNAGSLGGPDLVRQAELARYEKRRPKREPGPAVDPEKVARACLRKAGFEEKELDAVQPLLHAARANSAIERQLGGPPPADKPWTRAGE